MMIKKLICILSLSVFLMSFSTYTCTASTSATVVSRNQPARINVVMDDNYPPFVFRDSNEKLQGILVDQWALFEKKTGIKVNIHAMSWGKALNAMEKGQYDVIDTIFKNADREKIFDFTEEYAKIEVPIYFNSNITGISGIQSLKGFTVAAKTGDNAINLLKKNGITDIKEYDSYEQIVRDAHDQKIVVFFIDKPPALYYMYKYKIQDKFNFTKSQYDGAFRRAVKKGNTQMLAVLADGFGKISKSEYDEINKKWYGTPSASPTVVRYVTLTTVVVLILLVLSILWNRMLQGKVTGKTHELESLLAEHQKSDIKLKAILEAIPDPFFLIDRNGMFVDYHGVKSLETYVPPEIFLGRCLKDIFPTELSNKFMKCILYTLDTGEMQIVEYSLIYDGKPALFECRIAACYDDKVIGIVRSLDEFKKED